MKKMIRQIMALATLCWVMASCSDDTFNQEYGEGMGYLRLTLGKVDVELTSTTKAEANSIPEGLIPTTANFMIDIKQGSTSVEGFPKKYSELREGIELMAGGYTVTAYYGENEPIQATPYFSGSSTVEIYPGREAEAKIEAALANAMVTPSVSENLQKHYSAWSLKLKAGELATELANQDDKTDGYLFAKADQPVTAVFEGTNILGKETSQEWTVISSATARTKYVIQCDPDLSISFGLKAIAEHTQDNSGNLNGTKVTLSFDNLSNVPISLITDWKATLVNATGVEVRSYSTTDFTNTEMDVVDNWTYLPQGDYTLKYSYTLDGEKVSEEETGAEIITMPLPTFGVEVSAQTSYSVYTTQGAAVANEKDGSGIFDISTTTTISPDILEKYANLLSISYSLNSGESTTAESPIFQNLQWGKHTLTASVSFDGSNVTSSVDCDVTGIPYYVNFNGNTNPANWTLSNNGKCGNRLTLKKGEAYALSPKFYTPNDIETNVILNAYAYGGSLPYDYKPTVSIHPSESGDNSTVTTTLSGSIEVPGTATFHDINTTFTLTNAIGKICIYTKGNITKWSIGIGDIGVVCDHFSVQYK